MTWILIQTQFLKVDLNNPLKKTTKKFNKVDLKIGLKWAENNKAYFLTKNHNKNNIKKNNQFKDGSNQLNSWV